METTHLLSLSIGGKVVQVLSALASDIAVGSSALVQFRAVDTDAALGGGGATESTVALAGDGLLESAGANVDGALVGGVPVASSWGLLRQGQVGLGLVDLLRFVLVLVDDGLEAS